MVKYELNDKNLTSLYFLNVNVFVKCRFFELSLFFCHNIIYNIIMAQILFICINGLYPCMVILVNRNSNRSSNTN